ncbi:MAG: DUF362 domain-containing protein [Euryarchaeota archaeon]|jgi:uncharacterized protein (DUF362 family)/NAD-dependent dihydropyrimidine dehydrogenase PreA subunit|nr:DUF362 domain-containing protein [Euryarchaeota archaeon]
MSTISISQCSTYDLGKVKRAVNSLTDSLGGLDSFLDRGDVVLLKPNLLQARPPEDMVTTHPHVLEAIIMAVKDLGGTPVVGDSPGGPPGDRQRYWDVSGMGAVCRRHDVNILNFEKEGSYHMQRNSRDYYIAKPVLDCDLLINIPKIKTHGLTMLTCAIKNMYGVVPGAIKMEYHRNAPKPSDFAKLVVDIYALARPGLHIVDGVVGMEGNGPSAGDTRDLGMILAGKDGVAMDSLICHILGRAPLQIPNNRVAGEQGLGETDITKIDILGNIPEIKDFKWPSNLSQALNFIPRNLTQVFMKYFWTKPVIDRDRCTNCRKCVESCPTKALKGSAHIPEFDYEECINCLCCMEMCTYKAVTLEKSLIYSIGSKFSKSLN